VLSLMKDYDAALRKASRIALTAARFHVSFTERRKRPFTASATTTPLLRSRSRNRFESPCCSRSSKMFVPFGIRVIAIRPSCFSPVITSSAALTAITLFFILGGHLTARNRQIDQHRQWMVRSYAMTTFVSSRVLNLWPLY